MAHDDDKDFEDAKEKEGATDIKLKDWLDLIDWDKTWVDIKDYSKLSLRALIIPLSRARLVVTDGDHVNGIVNLGQLSGGIGFFVNDANLDEVDDSGENMNRGLKTCEAYLSHAKMIAFLINLSSLKSINSSQEKSRM